TVRGDNQGRSFFVTLMLPRKERPPMSPATKLLTLFHRIIYRDKLVGLDPHSFPERTRGRRKCLNIKTLPPSPCLVLPASTKYWRSFTIKVGIDNRFSCTAVDPFRGNTGTGILFQNNIVRKQKHGPCPRV
ncbi:MAG: hypothetical protein H6Q71_454, partial [Firmicutes bacterium]|nr:hypothetical protein [Bacillota bacterium]